MLNLNVIKHNCYVLSTTYALIYITSANFWQQSEICEVNFYKSINLFLKNFPSWDYTQKRGNSLISLLIRKTNC